MTGPFNVTPWTLEDIAILSSGIPYAINGLFAVKRNGQGSVRVSARRFFLLIDCLLPSQTNFNVSEECDVSNSSEI